jgi:hypothetical protein
LESKVTTKKYQDCYSNKMHEHGFYNPDLKKWYCSYFMDEEEWMEIHNYLPSQVQEHLFNSESSEEI